MKHPIYRPIAIGALLALASLTARAADYKETSTKAAQTPTPAAITGSISGAVTKVSQAGHAVIMLAA